MTEVADYKPISEEEFKRPPVLAVTFNPLYLTLHAFASVAEQVAHETRVAGSKYFPLHGAALLAPNHNSDSDTWVSGLSVQRPIHYMAKDELWTRKYAYMGHYLLAPLGCFPVNVENPGTAPIRHSDKLLQPRWYRRGLAEGIFPEGTRYVDAEKTIVRGDEIGELHESVARLSVKHDAPVHAMGIGNASYVKPNGKERTIRRVVLKPGIKARYGLPKKAAEKDVMEQFEYALREARAQSLMAARSRAAQLAEMSELLKS